MHSLMLQRLNARDRALFLRWSIFERASTRSRVAWTAITHLGGAATTIAATTLPIAYGGPVRAVAERALATLVASHLVVRVLKQSCGRLRPSAALDIRALVHEPGCSSFPSGHAAAAMAVAFVYAMAFPSLAPILIPGAVLVGVSRVCLGVHYPGDVLIGQLIAVLTAVPIVLRG